MIVTLKNGNISDIPEEEKNAYVKWVKEKYPDDIIDEIILTIGEDGFVGIEIHKHSAPFVRLRRITGYLVGTLDRFNNAKLSEVKDRVKHGIEDSKGVY